jgi:hypothetical protein
MIRVNKFKYWYKNHFIKRFLTWNYKFNTRNYEIHILLNIKEIQVKLMMYNEIINISMLFKIFKYWMIYIPINYINAIINIICNSLIM